MSSPFKTPEFLALFAKWNQILEDNGLKEIEDFTLPDPPLKAWHNHRFRKTVSIEKIQETQRYYELARELLHTFRFRSPTHRRVWELHCEGLSVRKIARVMKMKKLTKTTVHVIIIGIEVSAGLKND